MFEKLNKKTLKAGGYTFVLSVAAVVIAVLINVLVSKLPHDAIVKDTTENDLTGLSDSSVELIKGIDEDITVYLLNETEDGEYLRVLLEKVSSLNPKIKIEAKNTFTEPAILSQYGDMYYPYNGLIVVSAKRYTKVSYFALFYPDVEEQKIYEFFSENGSWPDLTGYEAFDGENRVVSALNYVSTEKLPVVYLLGGHDEPTLYPTLSRTLTDENFELRELDLSKTGGVPGDCDCLIINVPQKDITGEELKMLSDYADRGGKTVLSTKPETQRSPTYVQNGTAEETSEETGNEPEEGEIVINLPNLYEFTRRFGLEIEFGLVIEDPEGDHFMAYPTILLPDVSEHALTSPLAEKGMIPVLPTSSSIRTVEGTECKVTPLLYTGENAYIAEEVNTTLERDENNRSGRFTVCAISEMPSSGNGKTPALVWIASPYVTFDYLVLSESEHYSVNTLSKGANFTLYVNSLAYLCEKSESVRTHDSKVIEEEIMQLSENSSTLLKILFIGLVPAAVAAAGVAVIVVRRKK